MSDELIEAHLASYVDREALHQLRDWIITHSTHIIPNEWDISRHPLHFGIDMMVVRSQVKSGNSQFKFHPCVEINLRLNMGIIAHEIYRRLLAPDAKGMFRLTFFADTDALLFFHREQQAIHPAIYSSERLISGYLPLTPISEGTRHHAYIICD